VKLKAKGNILLDGVRVTVNAPLDIEVAKDCHYGSLILMNGSALQTNSHRIQFTGGSINLDLTTIFSAGESSLVMSDVCGATYLGNNDVPNEETSISLTAIGMLFFQ
jgi:hypothetical protein